MRIRGVHVAFGVIALITLFVVFAAQRAGNEGERGGGNVGQVPPASKPADQVPVIEVETAEFDAGVIGNQGPSHRKLRVWNRGKAPLKISDVRTTCACTTGKPEPSETGILPGAESYIDITLDPFRIPGFHSKKTITILSNDPKHPMFDVSVSARVEPEFDLVPEEADFGEVQKGQSPVITMIARQRGDAPLEIKKAGQLSEDKEVISHPALECVVEKRPESNWAAAGHPEYAIAVRLSPATPPGEFGLKFGIETNFPRLPSVWCLAKGKVTACYTLTPSPPSALMLTKGGLKAAPEQIGGSLAVAADRPIQLSDVNVEGEKILAEPRTGETPEKAYIDVRLAPGTAAGILSQAVTFIVHAGDAQYPERVPVRALAK